MARTAWLFGCEEYDDSKAPAEPATTEVAQDDVDDTESSVEAQLIEVEGLDAEICTLHADANELQEDTRSMENMESAVAEAAEDGGMDETAARISDVAMESYCNRWGIDRKRVATESFAGGSRSQATVVALEGIGDSIKGAFESFGKWVQEIVNKMRDFWVKYINAGKAVKKRAQKLKQRVARGLGELKSPEIGGYWQRAALINQKTDIKGVMHFIDNCDKGIAGFSKKLEDAVSLIKFGGDLVFHSIDTSQVIYQALMAANGVFVSATVTSTQLRGAGRVPANAKNVEVFASPGEGYFVSYTNPDDGRKSVTFAQHEIGQKHWTHDVKTPTSSEIDIAIEKLLKCGDIMETKLVNFRDGQQKLAHLNAEIKAAVSTLDKAKSREEIQIARKNVWAAKDALSDYNTITRAVTTGLTNASSGLIGYISAGIGAYAKVKDEIEVTTATA